MKRLRFPEEQIIGVLKEAEAGAKTGDLARCHGGSEATIFGADWKSMRYRSQRDDDAGLRSKLRELAHPRRRFGYCRLHILHRREGVVINRKKTQRP